MSVLKRQHPIRILTLMSKNFWLLFIPLIRGILALRPDINDIYAWISGAWVDIIVVLFIILSAVFRYRYATYEITSEKIISHSGVFIRKESVIPVNSLTAVTGEKKFLFRPFRAVVLYFDTDAGRVKGISDLTLTVRYDDYEKIFKTLALKKEDGIKAEYRPKKSHLVFFSIVFSSALSGIIFLSTFFIQSAKIVGESLENMLYVTVDDVATRLDRIMTGIPKIAITVSLVILAGWIYSAAANLLRYVGFRIERANTKVSIRTGFFTKRHYSLDTEKIFSADVKQNFLMKLFSVMSVQVDCAGYGHDRREIPVIIPITTKERVLSTMKLILPKMNITKRDVRPKPNCIFRYICVPFFMIILIIPAAVVAVKLFPVWQNFIVFMAIMLEIPSIIFLGAKIAAYLTTGISVSSDSLCIKYSFGTGFHTIIVPIENIVKISVTQSIFQAFSKACNVTFHTKTRLIRFHFVLALPYEETAKYLNDTGLCSEILKFS